MQTDQVVNVVVEDIVEDRDLWGTESFRRLYPNACWTAHQVNDGLQPDLPDGVLEKQRHVRGHAADGDAAFEKVSACFIEASWVLHLPRQISAQR